MKNHTIIELTGLPNSGKTTLIHRLAQELPKRYGITVQVQREDAEIVPTDIPKKTWDRNVWITFGQLQSLVHAYHSPADVVLLDRGFFDAMFWAHFMSSQGTSTLNQSAGIINILNSLYTNLNFYPDYLFLIDVSVQESLKRRALMEGASVYSKPDFLNSYHDKFFELFKDYIYGSENANESHKDKTYNKVIPIPSYYYNTSRMTPDEIFTKVEADIVNICCQINNT